MPQEAQPDDFLQASGKVITQLAPLVAFTLALTLLLDKVVTQPLLAQFAEMQAQTQEMLAQTQAQLERIEETLEEVPSLAGNVERVGKETDFLLSSR